MIKTFIKKNNKIKKNNYRTKAKELKILHKKNKKKNL